MDVAIRAFLDSGPYKVGTERDPDTRKLIYYVIHVQDVPTDITQIAADAIGNMVSILDHLAFRLYREHTPGGAGRHVYFPIISNATNAAEYVTKRERKVKGIEPTIVIPALDALEPYQGGKWHQFWVLNELNNLAKHRDPIAVGSRFRSLDLVAHPAASLGKFVGRALPDVSAFYKVDYPLCPLKVGDELFIDAPGAEPDPKMKSTFDVAINEPQIIQAEPLIETIHQLAGLVYSTIGRFARYL